MPVMKSSGSIMKWNMLLLLELDQIQHVMQSFPKPLSPNLWTWFLLELIWSRQRWAWLLLCCEFPGSWNSWELVKSLRMCSKITSSQVWAQNRPKVCSIKKRMVHVLSYVKLNHPSYCSCSCLILVVCFWFWLSSPRGFDGALCFKHQAY